MSRSQSLLLFRAFQNNKLASHRGSAVAIPSFIQGISTKSGNLERRNRLFLPVAIPSFIQGISTFPVLYRGIPLICLVAIPSFIQGISTKSMHLLGLGRPQPVAIPSFIQGISTINISTWNSISLFCRNPFLYSGHFNKIRDKCHNGEGTLSQSLPLFRAFQLIC